ncbi:MAG: ZIP family metal transporter [Nitrososphaeraceae archaeon]
MEEYESRDKTQNTLKNKTKNAKIIVFGLIPFLVLSAMIAFLLSPVGQGFINTGIPLPELTIEKIEFQEGNIVAYVRNTGPMDVVIVQADVNDRIHPAAIEPNKELSRLNDAKIIIPFSWNPGEPYEVGITVDDGTRFSKVVEAAALAPSPNVEQIATFALIGTYVGIIPVMIGLLWYPFIKTLNPNKLNFFLSITIGLLVFLGIDSLLEANEVIEENIASSMNGQILLIMITIISFLGLMFISKKLTQKTETKILENKSKGKDYSYSDNVVGHISKNVIIKPLTLSFLIAIGIGLHNFGEGLAIGSAVLLGEIALSTFLIIGFTLHNTTEGLAIVAPLAKKQKMKIKKLAILGLVAGGPTIIGAWIGGFFFMPIATALFLGVGAGAIFQVIYHMFSWMSSYSEEKNIFYNGYIIAGFVIGLLIMYITGLLI